MESLLSKYRSRTDSQCLCDGILIEGDFFTITVTGVNARIEMVPQIYFQTPHVDLIKGSSILLDLGSNKKYIVADSNPETFETENIYGKYRLYPVNTTIKIKETSTVISKVTGKPVTSPTLVFSDEYPCHIYEKEQTLVPSAVKQTFKVIAQTLTNLKDTSSVVIEGLGERQITNFFKQNGVCHFEV